MPNSPLTPSEALVLKRQFLAPCVGHFYDQPAVIDRGEGVWLYDTEGNQYLDLFSGVSVNHLGHANPAIVKAIQIQSEKLSNMTTIYLTEPALRLAKELSEICPIPETKVFFCSSGSEANESAVFFAKNANGKPGILSLSHGLHGSTHATLSMTGLNFWKGYLKNPDNRCHHGPSPECLRCPVGKNKSSCSAECTEKLEEVLSNNPDIGTIILEVLPGNGGILEAPTAFFEQIQEIINKYHLTLITDEVQTGFGRTGTCFASEHYGLKPDIITIAKSIGGGIPMGAVLVRSGIVDQFKFPRASTFGTNCIAASSALAFLSELRKLNIFKHVQHLGDLLKQKLQSIHSPWIADVRGLGLMIGVELCEPESSEFLPAIELTNYVLEEMKNKGFLLGRGGALRNVLIWQPPLIVEWEELVTSVEAFKDILSSWETKAR